MIKFKLSIFLLKRLREGGGHANKFPAVELERKERIRPSHESAAVMADGCIVALQEYSLPPSPSLRGFLAFSINLPFQLLLRVFRSVPPCPSCACERETENTVSNGQGSIVPALIDHCVVRSSSVLLIGYCDIVGRYD